MFVVFSPRAEVGPPRPRDGHGPGRAAAGPAQVARHLLRGSRWGAALVLSTGLVETSM